MHNTQFLCMQFSADRTDRLLASSWRHVRLSVCPSSFAAPALYRAKVVPAYRVRVPSRQVPIGPFRHFCCSSILSFSYRLQSGWKCTKIIKRSSWRKREREFFCDRESGMHWSCYENENSGQSRLSGLSLGAFTHSTRWIGSCISAVRKLETETSLTACQYTVRCTQYDQLSNTPELLCSVITGHRGNSLRPLEPR